MSENVLNVLDELRSRTEGRANVPLPDENLLSAYQEKHGLSFPEEYKVFLKEVMNVLYGTKDPLVITMAGNGYGELSEAITTARAVGVPKDWLPICENNGDYYCLLPDGRVRFWSHDGESRDQWPDLATWVQDVWIEGK